jgi:ATP-binding cassette subfamily G (WHITE) protein 2 (SNQ2)
LIPYFFLPRVARLFISARVSHEDSASKYAQANVSIAGTNSKVLLDYFAKNGAPCDPDTNPAEHIIDVVSGAAGGGRDWHSIWLESSERQSINEQLAWMKADALSRESPLKISDGDFATPLLTQLKIVGQRQCVALWRNPDYVWNKFMLHIGAALFSGFTFWKLGSSANDMQLRLLCVFNFLFVAVGVINQLQPLFLHYRDIFEAREKKVYTLPNSRCMTPANFIQVKNVLLGRFRHCPTRR